MARRAHPTNRALLPSNVGWAARRGSYTHVRSRVARGWQYSRDCSLSGLQRRLPTHTKLAQEGRIMSNLGVRNQQHKLIFTHVGTSTLQSEFLRNLPPIPTF